MRPGRSWRRVALIEVSLMTGLLLSYIWGWQNAFDGASMVVVGLYFGIGYLSHRRRGESAAQVGLRLDNWRAAGRNALPVIALFLLAAAVAGAALDGWRSGSTRNFLDGIGDLLSLSVWTTAQQYGLVCFFYRRCLEIFSGARIATAGAASLFALFHLPNTFLVVVTLAAGFVCCALYRRAPNVFVLGIAHALISYSLMHALPLSLTHGLRVGPGYFDFQ